MTTQANSPAGQPVQMTPAQAVEEYLKLRELNASIESESVRLKKINSDRMDLIEKLFITSVITDPQELTKTYTTGKAERTKKRRVKAADWEKVYKFIAEDPAERMAMLQKRFHESNALEALDWDDMTETFDINDVPDGFAIEEFDTVKFSVNNTAAAKKAIKRAENDRAQSAGANADTPFNL